MIETAEDKNIRLGDVVQVIARDEYKSVQSQNIVGVVVKVFYAEGETHPSAYGVRSNGEVVYYLADHISRVNIEITGPTTKERLSSAIANDIIDQMLCKSMQ